MSNELGKFLKTRIINAGMSQKDFAQQLDLSPTALSQIITGKVKPAASDNLQDNEIAKSFARRRTDAHKNV